MTKEDKYAVVVDGEVVDTAPTKKAANEILETVPGDSDTDVREFDAENDVVVPRGTDSQGIQHLR